jgi:uncharacterized damage-inducible protein DinB
MKNFREGAIGALLDEYEKAVVELQSIISDIPDSSLLKIIDNDTTDENCRSLQSILSHVVYAGFGYAASIYNCKAHMQRPPKSLLDTVAGYTAQLSAMFYFTEEVLLNFQDNEMEELDNSKKIMSGWGQVYDMEQMMEHAIVHILRHRRQIEKLWQTL